jgi:hypothetical protein
LTSHSAVKAASLHPGYLPPAFAGAVSARAVSFYRDLMEEFAATDRPCDAGSAN